MKNNWRLPISLVGLFFVISTLTLSLWEVNHFNSTTGDEPHYLVMARGLIDYASFEQTQPYRDAFKYKRYILGWPKGEPEPSPQNTHAVLGPRGLYNIHNIGLPILAAPAMAVAKLLRTDEDMVVRVWLIALNSILVFITWLISGLFSKHGWHRYATVLAVTMGLPFMTSATQIFPDLMGGILSLLGIYWLYRKPTEYDRSLEAIIVLGVAFLPWFHIKYALNSAILIAAIIGRTYFRTKNIRRIAELSCIAGTSLLLLIYYNYYSSGSIMGPYHLYSGETLNSLNSQSVMMFLGNLIDQNHGFITLNPIHLIGLTAIGSLFITRRWLTCLWLLLFIIPNFLNSMHVSYGGTSFSGRFSWTSAAIFILPTVYGLLCLAKRKEKLFYVLIGLGLILQIYLWYLHAIEGINLYGVGASTWPNAYSIFYLPIASALPMLYNAGWAYEYLPNAIGVALVIYLVIIGFFAKDNIIRNAGIGFMIATIATVPAALANFPAQSIKTQTYLAAHIEHNTGTIGENLSTIAIPNQDGRGRLGLTPRIKLGAGKYKISAEYNANAPSTQKRVLTLYIRSPHQHRPSETYFLPGTDSQTQTFTAEIEIKADEVGLYELGSYWLGNSQTQLFSIKIDYLYD